MESMKLVGRGFRSATKASQRAYLRRPLGSPRRQIAEPRSSMCQCPAGWNVQKSGFLANWPCNRNRLYHASCLGEILISFGNLAKPMLSYAPR
jgi:hypothetical protein